MDGLLKLKEVLKRLRLIKVSLDEQQALSYHSMDDHNPYFNKNRDLLLFQELVELIHIP